MAKSRFNRRRTRPGRFFVYLLAGAFVLALGGVAAEHGGPTFNGALVAKSAKPAPPAPAPSKNNNQASTQSSPNLQTSSGVVSNTSSDTVPPSANQCTTHSNKQGTDTHTKCTASDGSAAGGTTSCPQYSQQTNQGPDKVRCQKNNHPQPTQCWWSTTDTHTHNGVTTTNTQWRVYNDKEHPNGNEPKNERCEASGS